MPALSALLHRASRSDTICTGLDILDRDLSQLHGLADRGLPRKSITELSGPPGTAKTCLALTLIIDALRQGLTVRWLGCGHRPFPHTRLAELAGGEFPTSGELQCLNVDDIGQLLVFNLASGCDLVVIEHYDALIVPLSARKHNRRYRQYHCILDYLVRSAAQGPTIVCTSTAIPQREHTGDDNPTVLPAFVMPKECPAKRVALYRDIGGVITTYTGLRIVVHKSGLTALDGRAFSRNDPANFILTDIPTTESISSGPSSPSQLSGGSLNSLSPDRSHIKREAHDYDDHQTQITAAHPSRQSATINPAIEASWESEPTASSPLHPSAHSYISAGLGHVAKRIKLTGDCSDCEPRAAFDNGDNDIGGDHDDAVPRLGMLDQGGLPLRSASATSDAFSGDANGSILVQSESEPGSSQQHQSSLSSGEYQARHRIDGESVVLSSQLEWTDLQHIVSTPAPPSS